MKSKSTKGETIHFTVGALIKKKNKYLLIERAMAPYGHACVAGHINKGESKEEALLREVKEETKLKVKEFELVAEEILETNWCNKGATIHHWYIFLCDVSGKIIRSEKLNRGSEQTQQIDVSGISSGMYFFILHTEEQTIGKKLVID